MNNPRVKSQGSNQYLVSIGNVSHVIDLDGYTFCTDDDWSKLESAGCDPTNMYGGTLVSPQVAEEMASTDDDGDWWLAAVNEAVNYSGFDVDEAIKTEKE